MDSGYSHQEIVDAGQGLPGAKEVGAADWIHRKPSQNKFAVNLLRDRLDAGESEAIILAMETGAGLLLIDEARGRRVAEAKCLVTIGCLGCLVLAKQKALLEQVTPLMDQS
jgi:predicted nucleic acid-binding protein